GPAPAGPGARALRAPVVAGFLTSGAGVPTRPVRTTVKDTTVPRRPAPTVDSVRTGTGKDLPVDLRLRTTPAVPQDGTMVVSRPPRTVVPGAIRSYRQNSSAVAGVLDARALAAGEVVTLAMPDAAIDTDAGPRARPTPGRLTATAGVSRATAALRPVLA